MTQGNRYDFCVWRPSSCGSVGLEFSKAKGVFISKEMETSCFIYAYKNI